MSEEIDPAERAAYGWSDLTRDVALSTALTLREASDLVINLQINFPAPGGREEPMPDVVPYDIAQPLIRLLNGVQTGEYRTVGANLLALLRHAQDVIRHQPDPTGKDPLL